MHRGKYDAKHRRMEENYRYSNRHVLLGVDHSINHMPLETRGRQFFNSSRDYYTSRRAKK